MKSPLLKLIRGLEPRSIPGSIQRRFRRSRPGSVLILVVALLVLMSLIGVAYITSARVDRYSAKQNTFNTEVDLLLQALVQLTQRNIASAKGAPTDTPTGSDDGKIWTSAQDANWFGDRVPVLLSGNVPGWRFVAVSQTGTPFESPWSVNGNGIVQYTTRENLEPTSITVTTTGGTLVYPAFYDTSSKQTYLAASAAGDGVADAPLFRLPVGQLDGITYYGAARIIDNNSAINVATADQLDATAPGQFFPSNVDLLNTLVNSSTPNAQQQMVSLDAWRFNGSPASSLIPVSDDGTALPAYSFMSPQDALWSQLGRRLGNPGRNSSGKLYQSLSSIDAMSLARRFTLANTLGAGSQLEIALNPTLVQGIRSVPYSADQVTAWFMANFMYENGGGNRRPIMTVRNTVSNISASRFARKGKYDATQDYKFGDWVLYPDDSATGRSYVCVLDIDHTKAAIPPEGDANNSALCWAPQPWVQYPLKTPVNTGTFGQLWLSYWGAMCDTANTPSDLSAKTMFRNPIRSAVSASGDPTSPQGGTIQVQATGGDDTATIQSAIFSSARGSTLAFSGTYHISSTINFLAGRTYSGGGSSQIAALTPDETMRLRAALASINTLQLRSNQNDIVSKTFSMGGAVKDGPTGDGDATFITTSDDVLGVQVSSGSGPTIFEGITFSGGKGIVLQDHADGVTIRHCTMKDSGQLKFANLNDVLIDHNTFNSTTPYTIDGHANNNESITNNKFDLRYQSDGADWQNNAREEAFHVDPGGSGFLNGLTISGNTIIGNHLRWAFEVQSKIYNYKVQNNYISFQTGSAMSCPTGAQIKPGYPDAGENIEISGNVISCANGNAVQCCALEIDGDKNVVVHDNYFGGCMRGIVNGTGGAAGGGLITRNNVIIADENMWYNDYDGQPWVVPPRVSTGDKLYVNGDPNAPAPPATSSDNDNDPSPVDPSAAAAKVAYRVTVFGSAPQPYITEVYANNDQSTNGGYVAVELYNPYAVAISVHNWQLATIDRGDASDHLAMTQLSAGLEAAMPAAAKGMILPRQRLVITNTTDSGSTTGPSLPAGITGTMAPSTDRSSPDSQPPVYAVIPELSQAFDKELVVLRPRRADGTLTQSNDPTNYYNEVSRLADMAPVDSYDLTGLEASASADELSVEWHYIRPNDINQGKAWHWVYPYTYTSNPTAVDGGPVQPRLVGTLSRYYDPATGTDISSVGHPDAAPATAYVDMPLEVNNTGLGATMPKTPNQYPFGGFARNGDVLGTTFVGSYRIDFLSTDPKTKQLQTGMVELNALTMDSSAADDLDTSDDAGENIGRFAPLHADDGGGVYDDFGADVNKWSAYHFGMRLFDFVTIHAPHDDYMPNTDPAVVMGAYPVANANPAIRNATVPGSNEDNVGVDGLININTAPWRVLAALPIVGAENVAKAIVLYRDGDGTAANPPHGPFTSIFQLNAVPGFRAAFQPMTFEVTPSQNRPAGDYQTQFLTLNQISSMITTRSDTFTAYVIVQGWRGIGTKTPELVVQRRAAFLADRSAVSSKTPGLITRNVPVN